MAIALVRIYNLGISSLAVGRLRAISMKLCYQTSLYPELRVMLSLQPTLLPKRLTLSTFSNQKLPELGFKVKLFLLATLILST